MLVQLKPHQETFYKFVMNKLRSLDAIVLCEGKMEVKVVKRIIRKLNLEIKGFVGITNCEGISHVPVMTCVVALLARLARKLKVIAVIMDAEEMSIKDRAESMINSLRARKLNVEDLEPINSQVFRTFITINEKKLTLLIAINGDYTLPFEKHKIEDHIVKLMILESKIEKMILRNTRIQKK